MTQSTYKPYEAGQLYKSRQTTYIDIACCYYMEMTKKFKTTADASVKLSSDSSSSKTVPNDVGDVEKGISVQKETIVANNTNNKNNNNNNEKDELDTMEKVIVQIPITLRESYDQIKDFATLLAGFQFVAINVGKDKFEGYAQIAAFLLFASFCLSVSSATIALFCREYLRFSEVESVDFILISIHKYKYIFKGVSALLLFSCTAMVCAICIQAFASFANAGFAITLSCLAVVIFSGCIYVMRELISKRQEFNRAELEALFIDPEKKDEKDLKNYAAQRLLYTFK